MDPQTDLPDLVEDLEVNIDELTATLAPLLPPTPLSKTATSLPLLDKAKLHVLAAYAIESTLFSTLQASGADAKAHAIFAELARLKGYFAKIKHAEDHVANLAAKEKRARLDVGAAQRFIKHGLSGNERYDEMRKERLAAEKARALEKARAVTNKKFEDEESAVGEKRRGEEEDDDGTPKKKARLGSAEDEEEDDEEEEEEEEEEVHHTPAAAPPKRGRRSKNTDTELVSSHPDPAQTPTDPEPPKKKRGRPSKKQPNPSTPQKNTDTHTPARATRSSASKAKAPRGAKAKK